MPKLNQLGEQQTDWIIPIIPRESDEREPDRRAGFAAIALFFCFPLLGTFLFYVLLVHIRAMEPSQTRRQTSGSRPPLVRSGSSAIKRPARPPPSPPRRHRHRPRLGSTGSSAGESTSSRGSGSSSTQFSVSEESDMYDRIMALEEQVTTLTAELKQARTVHPAKHLVLRMMNEKAAEIGRLTGQLALKSEDNVLLLEENESLKVENEALKVQLVALRTALSVIRPIPVHRGEQQSAAARRAAYLRSQSAPCPVDTLEDQPTTSAARRSAYGRSKSAPSPTSSQDDVFLPAVSEMDEVDSVDTRRQRFAKQNSQRRGSSIKKMFRKFRRMSSYRG
ncbi:PREDICTED: uncharacterized protein LOC109469910 [Branchiostoma belcheri]|uniref:Uncharacterized protein LOC109469910 n=1 Tax=Branchiostoma belcheri TaxID=7741 RepID=A0A6P4Y5D7_BRABE|nr:PREDICTED: uncharacterized protein LOC109469910 [Branchiostoma belcheri]